MIGRKTLSNASHPASDVPDIRPDRQYTGDATHRHHDDSHVTADEISKGVSPPRSGRAWKLGAGLLRSGLSLLLIGVGIVGFVVLGSGHPPQSRGEREVVKPIVQVAAVTEHREGIDFNVDGVVIAFREITIPAEVAGQVAFRSDNCRMGHMVKAGELLAKIDPADYQLEARRLEEELKQAEAKQHELKVETVARRRQIELAREDLAIQQREVQRYERIKDPGVYSKSEVDTARLKELQARDALQTEIDQLELLEAQQARLASASQLAAHQLDKARLELARTEIYSPIDGVVTDELVEQDCYLQKGAGVAVVQDTSCMEIRCSLQMKQMHWIWQTAPSPDKPVASDNAYYFPETPVTVIYEMESRKFRWEGKLQYYDGGKIDERTRMVPCRVRVCQPSCVQVDGACSGGVRPPVLMAGMFVTVRVHAKPDLALLRLPEAAVQPGGTVWAVRDQQLHELPVHVAHATREEVLVYQQGSELQAGDRVVVSPVAAPTEGAAVAVMGEQ